jgi:hypothetical protein
MYLEIRNYRRKDLVVPAAPAAGMKIPFPVDMEIDGKIITGVETYNNTQLAIVNAGAVVTAGAGAEATVFLVVGSDERIFAMPYQAFNTALNSGFIKLFKDLRINLTKSYIQLSSAATIVATNVLSVGFYYSKA